MAEQNPKRPSWVHCIERYRVDEKGKSWCGRDVSMEFKFLDPMHAAVSFAQGDRFMACPECVDTVTSMLSSARWDKRRG